MLNSQAVAAEAETIRLQVAGLSADDRAAYFRLLTPALKDPDTYAALNWSLIFGAHHIYLGHWPRFLLNLVTQGLALLCLLTPAWPLGAVVLALLLGAELWDLARAQVIVADYNNQISRRILADLTGQQS